MKKLNQLNNVCHPTIIGNEVDYLQDILGDPQIMLQYKYLKLCTNFLESTYNTKALLTDSCTSALEIVCLIEGWGKEDEIIMPSYTYVSTANAFVKNGVVPVFVDISPDTLNIDLQYIEAAITSKTKAVVAVHYAGVSCDMDKLVAICKKHNLLLIEDAAQAYGCYYNDQRLGTIGDYGTISFDQNKVIHSGQGGVLFVNKEKRYQKALEIYENGTNRHAFSQGEEPFYSWTGVGSKFVLSDLNCAFLYAQLLNSTKLIDERLEKWKYYYDNFESDHITQIALPVIPEYARHNAYQFHIRLKNEVERNQLKNYLSSKGIASLFHFIPLHSSPFGKIVGRFVGLDKYTTTSSQNLLRLPLYNSLDNENQLKVISAIRTFFKEE